MNKGKWEKAGTWVRYGWIPVLILVLVLLLAFNISIPGRMLEGCLVKCSTSLDPDPETLTIVSLNMLHGFPDFRDLGERLDQMVDHLSLYNPDLILLQEVPWTSQKGNAARILSEKLGLNYIFYRANGNRQVIFFEEGEAILSRYPLEAPDSLELEPQVGFFEHRVALHAVVTTPQGKYDVFVTHLTNKEPDDNYLQARSLLKFVDTSEEGIKIIAGDFNASEHSKQIVELSEKWVDAYRTANPKQSGFTCCYENRAKADKNQLGKRIDYFFISGDELEGITIEKMDVLLPLQAEDGSGYWFSDHAGLLLEIQVALP